MIFFSYWNVCGFGYLDTKISLKNFMSHKPVVIFLAEPMITFAQVPSSHWHSIGITKYCTNYKGNLLLNLRALWGSKVTPIIISWLLWVIRSRVWFGCRCCLPT